MVEGCQNRHQKFKVFRQKGSHRESGVRGGFHLLSHSNKESSSKMKQLLGQNTEYTHNSSPAGLLKVFQSCATS